MLILARKKNEIIEVGNNVRIHVVEIRGDKVRIGIEAPADCVVHRKEIADIIRAQSVDSRRYDKEPGDHE
jgi:carbon storage regulator